MPFDLEKISQLLRMGREEKGLSVEEVARQLYISKSVIRALEAGDWERLPHEVYVKGYISQYASFLELHRINDEIKPAQSAGVAEVEKPPPAVRKSSPPGRRRGIGRIVSVSFLIAFVVAFIVFQNMRNESGFTTPVSKRIVLPPTVLPDPMHAPERAVQPLSAAAPLESVSEKTYDNQAEKPLFESKKLVINCLERTWLRIVIDKSEVKELMLNPEEVVMFNAREDFDLLIGNAAGVRILFNGKDSGFTGKEGEVKRASFS
jgi:hypothetical protein